MALVIWRVNAQINKKINELMGQLIDHEPGSEEHYVLSDQIRSLPGCPLNTNESIDIIQVEVVDTPTVGYTSGLIH